MRAPALTAARPAAAPALTGAPLWIGGTAASAALLGALLAERGALLVLGALVLVAGALAAALVPRHALVGAAAVIPAISGLDRGLLIPGLRLSEALTVAICGPLILQAHRRWSRIEWAAAAYVAATAALCLFNLWRRDATPTADDLGTIAGPAQFFLLLRAASLWATTRELRERVVVALALGTVPVALLALAQAFQVGPAVDWMVSLTGSDWRRIFARDDLVRATGPFPHWQVLAGYLMVTGLLTAAAALRWPRRRALLVAVLALQTAALLRSATIGATLGLLAGGAALVVLSGALRRRGGLLPVVAAGVACVPLLLPVLASRLEQQFGREREDDRFSWLPQTLADRAQIWQDDYLPVLDGRWTLGYGPDIPPEVTWQFTESVYVTLALRGGLVLIAAYLAYMAVLWLDARRLRGSDPVLADAVPVIVAALLVTQTIATYFTGSGTPHVVWLVAGLVVAALYDGASRPCPSPPSSPPSPS